MRKQATFFSGVILFFTIGVMFFTSCEEEEPKDPAFRYAAYEEFVRKLSVWDHLKVVPLKDFPDTHDSTKIIVGLRHDVDRDLAGALKMAEIEKKYQIPSTYYILHTDEFYLLDEDDKSRHDPAIMPKLQELQQLGHEVGFHNDLVTLQLVYGLNSRDFFSKELEWFRRNGLEVKGTSAHGAQYCYELGYVNTFFFDETDDRNGYYKSSDTVSVEGVEVPILKGTFDEYGLTYEASFLQYNKFFADCNYPNGNRWHTGMLDFEEFQRGDRIVILTHPVHWW